MLETIIKTYLVNSAGVDPAKFSDPDLLVSDMGLDSLGLIEMLFEVEDEFGFQIPEPFRFMKMTFSQMVTDIETTVRSHHGGQLPDLAIAKPPVE